MFTILMISAKLANPNPLKIKIFQNDGIIPNYDVTKNILSRDSNYIVDAFLKGGLS